MSSSKQWKAFSQSLSAFLTSLKTQKMKQWINLQPIRLITFSFSESFLNFRNFIAHCWTLDEGRFNSQTFQYFHCHLRVKMLFPSHCISDRCCKFATQKDSDFAQRVFLSRSFSSRVTGGTVVEYLLICCKISWNFSRFSFFRCQKLWFFTFTFEIKNNKRNYNEWRCE